MTIIKPAGVALALLAAAALAFACDGNGNDGDGAATSPPDGTPAATSPGGTPGQGCIDPADLPPAAAPWEVGNDPVFFRFGLPDEVLQSGDVCPGDISLVVIRATGDVGDEPFLLGARNVDTGTELDFEVLPVDVPGEEGEFFNALVELREAGRWDFTVVIEGGSTTYRVPVREP